jgi:ABC-type molybdenum transport system ATPase subunit/photorepair protein PhrA
LTEVAISRGDTAILKGVEWSVQANERWGIVGTL